MGLLSNIAGRIERAFSNDRDRQIIRHAQGFTGPIAPYGFNQTSAYGYDALADYLRLDSGLLERYADYESMEEYPILSSALDVVADDSTQPDTVRNRTVWAESKNIRARTEIDAMLRRLNMDEEAWDITRSMCKNGDDYEEILVGNDGVIGLNFLPAPSVRRIEGRQGELYGFIQDPRGKIGYSVDDFKAAMARREAYITGNIKAGTDGTDPTVAFDSWEVAHFRMPGRRRRAVYGMSVLENARWIWRRLMLLEDAAMIYRLHRAPERFAFYVNVGDKSDTESMLYINRMRQSFNKNKYVNPRTGNLDLKVAPQSPDENFYVPFRTGEEGSRVEMLTAPAWQHMDDVEYFKTLLFAAIKIPRIALGDEEGAVRAAVSSQDIRFARQVLRVQRAFRTGMRHVSRVHLAAINLDPNEIEFDIGMTVPSSLLELAQIEARAARADLAARMREFVSLHWVLANVFNMGDAEIQRIFMQRDEDLVREGKAQGAAQAAAQPDMGGGFDMGGGDESGVPTDAEGMEARRTAQRATALLSSKLVYPVRRGSAITEREMFRGASRETERRAAEKLDKLLKNDVQLVARLKELGSLLSDLKSGGGTSLRK